MALTDILGMTEEQAKALSTVERHVLRHKLKMQILPVTTAISFLEQHCKHGVAALTETSAEYYLLDEWRSDGARCEGCGISVGWYCPDAPNHICDYEQEDGTFDSDSCKHCGMPDERK